MNHPNKFTMDILAEAYHIDKKVRVKTSLVAIVLDAVGLFVNKHSYNPEWVIIRSYDLDGCRLPLITNAIDGTIQPGTFLLGPVKEL